MTATLMRGTELAARIRAEVAEEVKEIGTIGLATVQVGEDEASSVYLGRKHVAAGEAGIRSVDRRLPGDIAEDELLRVVGELNDDDSVDGILVQLPLPGHLDEARIIAAVDPVKDVDGFHPLNAGQLYLGRPTHVPATPLGIMALLAENRIELGGARAVVIGRSDIVGKPIAHLLLQSNATVTICHSRTEDLERHTLDADVLVVAAGAAGIVSPDMVKSGAAVVDVGINRTDAGIIGDVDAGAADRAGHLTPVPGGVGPMTIAMLLRNTLRAARYRRGLLAFPEIRR
ncbi:MAG TPA: bifunctional 5,10-methylenetetrahydrofolate dehydrogenase/5,10-methenyltetrahydrofolate cyclohydrolase [Gaiellaceae bacterium]|jgi:methylenetetrahydrofolate dehydrogenase (NADP+)/methenyltetrahydrofolate cyclohydrolase|nr:bifunctional 5,10-methylenetetrahydrofolate dehydrogenase/5,10-methenyltetrahydrofolate cyclohydrolase [Gaiellaceae bacterium]